MNKEVIDLDYEIDIAKHNLWVARTIVMDRQRELDTLIKTKKLIEDVLT